MIQGIRGNSKLSLHLLAFLRLIEVVLIVTCEGEIIDRVTKVMLVSVTEVGHEVVDVPVVCLERTSRRQVQVSYDLADPNRTSNVASLRRLILELVRPAFLHALTELLNSPNGIE